MTDKPSATLHQPDAWKQAARSYAQEFEPFTSQYGRAALAKLAPQPGQRMLDLATGPGALALHAARTGVQVDAIDFSPGMIELLKERQAQVQASENSVLPLTASVMDGQALTFADASFDCVVSCFGVFLFPNHRSGLKEMHRVLVPGGRAAIVVWRPAMQMTLKPWWELFRDEVAGGPSITLPPGWVAMDHPGGMRAELEHAGFTEIEITEHNIGCPVTSARGFAESGAINPFIRQMLETQTAERARELIELLVARVEREYGTGPFEHPAAALVGVGRKG